MPVSTQVRDKRLLMIEMLLPNVESGYYAVRPDSITPYRFLRISRPTFGRYKGFTKIATQHGETFVMAAVVYPGTSEVRIYGHSSLIESLLLIITNTHQSARDYAKEIGRCCRCNKDLTDERSRHYGIGPVCDKVWAWMIEEVDEENDGMSYETMRAKGLCA